MYGKFENKFLKIISIPQLSILTSDLITMRGLVQCSHDELDSNSYIVKPLQCHEPNSASRRNRIQPRGPFWALDTVPDHLFLH